MYNMGCIGSKNYGVSGRNGLVRGTAGRKKRHDGGADSDQNRNEELLKGFTFHKIFNQYW